MQNKQNEYQALYCMIKLEQNEHHAIYLTIKVEQNDHHDIFSSIKLEENVRAIPPATSGLDPNEANRAGVRHIASKTCRATSGQRTAADFSGPKRPQ